MNIFVEKLEGEELVLRGADVNHLNVRRHKPGYFFKLVETEGNFFADAELSSISKKEAVFLVKKLENKPQSLAKIALYQAVIKKPKMELIVQKAVELGVDRIVPVITERVSEKGILNMERMAIIAREAAMQSERMSIPQIGKVVSLKEALEKQGLLCLAERSRGISIKDKFLDTELNPEISVLVGPEGGFSINEFELMKQSGVTLVSFGESIMRAETAAIAALSVIRCFYLTE